MAMNPINLAVRFLLEVAALIILAAWGWAQADGLLGYLMAVGFPLLAAALWGVFAVPDDPSRSGRAPVATPGILRLILELGFFGVAGWALTDLNDGPWSWGFALIVLLHYGLSYDRIRWLLRQ